MEVNKMKKAMMTIVNAIMAVTMVTAGYTLADKMMGETGAAPAYAATVRGTDNGVSSLVATAKRIQEDPAITSLGPLEIDGTTWRYTAKTVGGNVSVRIYEWTGVESLTQPLAEAIG
jgi:hypothetical protein